MAHLDELHRTERHIVVLERLRRQKRKRNEPSDPDLASQLKTLRAKAAALRQTKGKTP